MSVDIQAIEAAQQRARDFATTPIGGLLVQYERLLGEAWRADGQPHISDRRLREVWAKSDAARAELEAAIWAVYERSPTP